MAGCKENVQMTSKHFLGLGIEIEGAILHFGKHIILSHSIGYKVLAQIHGTAEKLRAGHQMHTDLVMSRSCHS